MDKEQGVKRAFNETRYNTAYKVSNEAKRCKTWLNVTDLEQKKAPPKKAK